MGFWNVLKNIGGLALDAVPGGAAAHAGLNMALKVGGLAGDVAGGIAQGREAGRDQANSQAMAQDQLRQRDQENNESALENRAKLALSQGQDARQATSDNYRNALLGALGMNIGDFHSKRPAGVEDTGGSGGLRPSALGLQGKEAAALLNNQAMQALLHPTQAKDLPAIERFTPTKMKTGGVLDNILGGIGIAGGVANKAMDRMNQNEQTSLIKRLLNPDEQARLQPVNVATNLAKPGLFGG